MFTVSRDQMQGMEAYTIQQLEISPSLLVENVAIHALDQLDLDCRHSFAIFCGPGNNGADGLALARHLLGMDKQVHVFLLEAKKEPSQVWRDNLRSLRHMTDHIASLESLGDLEDMIQALSRYNTIIDALFGTGLDRPLSGVAPVIIEQVNESRIFTISMDLPSGMDADTGMSYGAMVHADRVLAVEFAKAGLARGALVDLDIRIVSAGIPAKAKRWVLGDSYPPARP